MLANGGRDLDLTLVREIRSRDGEVMAESEIEELLSGQLRMQRSEGNVLDVNEANMDIVLEGMRRASMEPRRNSLLSIQEFSCSSSREDGFFGGRRGNCKWMVLRICAV